MLFSTPKMFAQADMKQFFETCKVNGSITLHHLETGLWIFSDSTDALMSSLPASTFKIFNSALALELNAVKNENEVFEWDGYENIFFGQRIDSWNEDIHMKRAFQVSAVWFYKKLAQQIGREEYRYWLDRIGYGNGNLEETGADFWNFGGFGISPKNQVRFLKALYKEELPFSADIHQTVKKLMIDEESESYKISGKTGWTKTDERDIGWWIGFVEKKEDTWLFATRISKDITSDNPDFSACRKSITESIFRDLEILPDTTRYRR
jgi:beta-lactamase class D